MGTAVSLIEPRIRDLHVTEEEITAFLVDGRTISVPLAWSWRLSDATPGQRSHFEIIGDGHGVHWHDIDEDISVEGCCTECLHTTQSVLIQRSLTFLINSTKLASSLQKNPRNPVLKSKK